MSSNPMITVKSLSKRFEIYNQPRDRLLQMVLPKLRRLTGLKDKSYFKEFWALSDVNFTVNRGETVAIIGKNGSGKSTLLQLVCGTLVPTTGRATVTGRIAALLELGAGFNAEFTGRENIFLSGLLYGLSHAELTQRYDAIVAFSEIGDFIDQPVKTYSSGMYVRLAFSIAAHVDADVLIVDEALSVGDVRFTQKCMRFLREFQQTGTLLFVSHDTSAVVGLCSRAIWLDHGKVRMDGPAKDTVEMYLAAQHALDRKETGATISIKTASPAKSNHPASALNKLNRSTATTQSHNAISDPSLVGRVSFFEFNPEQATNEFGAGDARITGAYLLAEDGSPLQIAYGGEIVQLCIQATIHHDLHNLIFGFYLKDRLGQRLFGDNSFQAYLNRPVNATTGEIVTAVFCFQMPTLPVGEYSFDLAIASGTQDNHTQQHWLHDALQVRATDTSMKHGLIGIPMLDISISKDA